MKSTSRSTTAASLVGLFLASVLIPVAALAQAVASPYTTGHWYDIAGRLTGTVWPCVAGTCLATRYAYNSAGLVSEEDDGSLGGWPASTSAPPQWTFSSIAKIVTYGYDTMGRLAWTTVSSAARVPYKLSETSYDQVDRVACVAVRMNPSAVPTGNACALTTASDRITETTYDAQDHPLDVYRGCGGASCQQHYAHYSYTLNGLDSAVTDANGNLTTFSYDGLDRLVETDFPSKTSPGTSDSGDADKCAVYDSDNNCETRVTRDGQIIQYQYDHLNRLINKTWPSPNSTTFYYTYDLQSHQLSATFGSASGQGVYEGYDGFGEMTSEKETMGSTPQEMDYQYDADGDRNRVTYPDGAYIQYTYDGLDRLQNVLPNGSTTVAAYSYDGGGRLQQISRGAGVAWTTYGYDPISRLSSLEHTFSSPADDVSYSLGYNPDDQITSYTISNDEYDILATGSESYASNGLNEYSTVGGSSFSYDGRGNLTGDASATYAYDVENHLTGSGLHNATLVYDPLGRLYEVSSTLGTTTFLYDGDRITAEYNGSGTLTNRYVYGVDGDDPIVWYQGSSVITPQYLFADHEGSISAVTNSGGDVFANDQYDTYGQVGTSSQNQGRFRFTGQAYIPDVGLYYYKARMYNPSLGRFMQTDPIEYKDDLDLYAYVGNDPMDRTDPTGDDAACVYAGDCQTFLNINNVPGNLKTTGEIAGAVGVGIATDGIGELAEGGSLLSKIGQMVKGIRRIIGIAEDVKAAQGPETSAPKRPDFVVDSSGTAFPVPKGAEGPSPVTNPAGKQTGVAYTGGNGGANGQVSTLRNMDPTPARGGSPGYPNGYVKYENAGKQGVDPYSGRTLPNSQSHFPKNCPPSCP
jgi:RHS repeat-associated protein